MRCIYDQHKGRYGYRRITIQLRDDGVIVNHKTVRKLMMSLKAKRKDQRYRSFKGDVGKIAPNVINRDFSADAPDQKWTTDVTQVKIKDRELFLSPILDMFNGEIISYQISSCPNMKMVLTMLKKAINKKKDLSGLILHSVMKSELLYLQDWESIDEFKKELRAYIKYYNNDRIKLRLIGKSPVQYRTLYLVND